MNILVRIIIFYYFTINYHYIVCPTVTCDFEIDECNWRLDSSWKIYPSGSTPDTASSGPTADHTFGNGSYARFMGTLLPETNQFGVMYINTSLQETTPFSFWYFMHGTQIGTLALVVNNQPLWQKSGRQGFPAWYQANVILPMSTAVQISFLANRTGLGRSSDIAIDDIVLQGEPMPASTRTTRTPPSTTPRTRFNASCDFDVDKELCGWKSDTKYGWKVIHEREPNITIGPRSDYSSIARSSDDGKFCKIPFDEQGLQYYCLPYNKIRRCRDKDNDKAWITCRDGGFVQIQTGQIDQVGERSQFDSPVLDAISEEGCVQFQYNIAGTDNDWLHVYVEDYWSGRQLCTWHKNGSSVPNQWMTAEAPLQLEKDGKYQIVFEARKGKAGGSGLVSIDHIIVSSKRCSGIFPVEECPYEEVPTSTSMMTTTIDVAITSNNVDTSTAEMELTTDKSTDAEMTTINIHTEAPTVFHTTISTTKTSTRTSTTSAITQTTPYIETPTTPIEITETEAKTSSETFTSTPTLTPRTTVSTTTLTTTNTPDIERPETTTTTIGDRPKDSSPVGIIVGTLAGVFAVVLIISLYLNRQKLYARFSSKSELNEQIIPKYVNSQSADGYVQLDHIAEQSSFA